MAKIYKGTGYFKNEELGRGELSSQIRLQDGNFYQFFSYVIQSPVSIDSWLPIVKKTTHPAGMKVFGEVSITSNMELYQGVAKDYQNFTTSVGILGPLNTELTDGVLASSSATVFTQDYVYSSYTDPVGITYYSPYFGSDYVAKEYVSIDDGLNPSGDETYKSTLADNVIYI